MARIEALIIGGGATGAGVARDLALRGVETLLLEKGDFCSGASGGNHGMLHSGARYAVNDPESAKECAGENLILKRIAAYCLEDCGGVFVSLPSDDASYPEKFEKACRSTGVVLSPLTRQEIMTREPSLNPEVVRAYAVEDASIDPFALVLGNIESARGAGAKALNYRVVQSFRISRGSIDEVVYRDVMTGQAEKVKPEVVINAAGAWAGQAAALAGLRLEVQVDKGSMVVMDGRLSKGLVNRLRPPSDGDIIVPHHSGTLLGTTSQALTRPGAVSATREEAQLLLREAAMMVPSVAKGRTVRAYASIRPLFSTSLGRGASRGYRVIDHASQGVDNLISVVGGKLTTYRLMAEKASDAACRAIGSSRASRTALSPICEGRGEPHMDGLLRMYSSRLHRKYGPGRSKVVESCSHRSRGKETACSCEQVLQGELDHFAPHPDVRTIGDLMRRTRAGMGYCQGGMCAISMASALAARTEQDPRRMLEDYLSDRWKGIWPVLEGEQLRQEVMKRYLLVGTYQLQIRERGP